jgi:hypothetical protein
VCCENVAHGAVGDENTSECVRKDESFEHGTCCGAMSAIMGWDRFRQGTVGANSDRHSRRHATTVRIHPFVASSSFNPEGHFRSGNEVFLREVFGVFGHSRTWLPEIVQLSHSRRPTLRCTDECLERRFNTLLLLA